MESDTDFFDSAGEKVVNIKHPGYEWTDDAACRKLLFNSEGQPDSEAVSLFFVEAGHVLSENIKELCRTCPVRMECLKHSYTGQQGGVITAGYYAGFSYGQRKNTPYEVLERIVKDESDRYRE